MWAAAPELGAIAALFACAFLIALYYAYGYSIGALLQLIAQGFRNLSINLWFVGRVGFGFVGDMIDGLDNGIRHALGSGIASTSRAWHVMWHYSAYVLERTGSIIEGLGNDTYGALKTLRNITVPGLIASAIAPLWRRLARIESEIATLPHKAEIVLEQPLKVIRETITKTAAVAGTITLPGLGRLERDAEAIRARLRSVEKALGISGLAGLVAVGLSQIGLGHLSCSQNKRLLKGACGMDTSLLDALLADALLIAGTISLVEMAEGMQGIVGEVAPQVRRFWRAT